MKPSIKLQADRIAALALVAVGALFLLVGWLRISDTPYPAEQLPYILSGGIAGIFFLGLGATLWISADLRDEWTTFDRIEEALRDLAGERPPVDVATSPDTAETAVDDTDEVPEVTTQRGRSAAGKRQGRLVATANGAAMSESQP